jgi:hypothetical protein
VGVSDVDAGFFLGSAAGFFQVFCQLAVFVVLFGFVGFELAEAVVEGA